MGWARYQSTRAAWRALFVACLLVVSVSHWRVNTSESLVTPKATNTAQGYRLASTGAEVREFGLTPPVTGPSTSLSASVAAMAATVDGRGYWLATTNGAVKNYGTATSYGPSQALRLNKPIVGMSATPTGNGYWMVATDGGIFSYGDAAFFGSTGAIRLNKPIVGIAATKTGKGYWMVASDGGIFSFGDAAFFGSTGNIRLNKPIVGMTITATGRGYWMVASDGGIFSFGDAVFRGSAGSKKLSKPIVGMATSPTGNGYWLAGADGAVFQYGDATYYGSATSPVMRGNVVAITAFNVDSAGSSAASYALAQVGDPYVYGATGPNSWDCSGLTQAAFKSVGVTIPRTAQTQFNAGPRVASGAPLQVGDLVFFGSSTSNISHVGIYLGNGLMVDAPHTGALVRVESYNWSNYRGATRPAPS